MKKLIGKTDIEDALKRLDKLTNEEVRIVTAQVLGATHTIEDRVIDVDNRVVGVDDRVASVDNKVKAVDDKVAMVIDGTPLPLIGHQEGMLTLMCLEGKETRVVIRQVADDMEQVKR